MKKLFITLSAAAALFLAGCDNENTVNPEPKENATISGVVYGNTNEEDSDEETENQQTDEVIPNVPVRFEYREGSEADGFTYAYIGEATTGADGKYTFEVPVGRTQPIRVTVGDFTMDLNVSDGDGGYDEKPYIFNKNTTSSISTTTITVVPGGAYIYNFNLGSQANFQAISYK